MSRRVALVTGASRGIGRAIAVGLAEEGLNVLVNYQANQAAAEETLHLVKAQGVDGWLCGFDVADAEQTDTAIRAAVEKAGALDVLVNNAGISRDGLLLRTKEKDWQDTLATNLSGAFHCCKSAVRYLLKSSAGRVINISSVIGTQGNAGQVSYAATKAGLHGLTRSLARELASRQITVNCVAPGFIETDMTAELLKADAMKSQFERIPLGRVGQPQEVAELVRFLASPRGGYITGQVIAVNGGLDM